MQGGLVIWVGGSVCLVQVCHSRREFFFAIVLLAFAGVTLLVNHCFWVCWGIPSGLLRTIATELGFRVSTFAAKILKRTFISEFGHKCVWLLCFHFFIR